jgi:hypothetical protein
MWVSRAHHLDGQQIHVHLSCLFPSQNRRQDPRVQEIPPGISQERYVKSPSSSYLLFNSHTERAAKTSRAGALPIVDEREDFYADDIYEQRNEESAQYAQEEDEE